METIANQLRLTSKCNDQPKHVLQNRLGTRVKAFFDPLKQRSHFTILTTHQKDSTYLSSLKEQTRNTMPQVNSGITGCSRCQESYIFPQASGGHLSQQESKTFGCKLAYIGSMMCQESCIRTVQRTMRNKLVSKKYVEKKNVNSIPKHALQIFNDGFLQKLKQVAKSRKHRFQ